MRGAALLAAVALVVAGVATVALVTSGRESDPAPSTATRPRPAATGATSAAPDTLRAVVDDLSAFVESVRELDFLRPVEVELLDGPAFAERLLEEEGPMRREAETTERVLRALDLIDDDVDVAAAVESYLADAVLGFYDARADALVVRGAEATPYVKTVLVHELTHALDDQHFDLDRPALDTVDDESGLAFSGLGEGDAVRVEDLYLRSLGEEERRTAADEERTFAAGVDLSGVPPFVAQLIAFPYLAGPRFVDALVDRGGEARVDAAFRAPPTTTESILDPEGFLDGEEVVDVAPPAAEGEVFDHGVLGAWAIVLILGTEVGTEDALDAVEGWAGDAYVAWAGGERTCLRATVVMDEGEAGALADAWTTWAEAHPDAQVDTAGGDVGVTACA